MNIEREKKNFENHIAIFTDYGNIKILDFKNPNSFNYRIRFLFEEDYCRLHISGDLGELIATNYNNMTFDKFSDFVNNTGYFEEKIDCHSRAIYYYDEELAREKLKEYINEYELLDYSNKYDWANEEDRMDYIINDILEDFTDRNGIGSKGYEELHELDCDCFEYACDLGKKSTGILSLYMLAFKLATEQLKEKEN